MKCGQCDRSGRLVAQIVIKEQPFFGIKKPWVLREYMCPFHLSGYNRRSKPEGFKKLEYIEFIEDSVLITKGD